MGNLAAQPRLGHTPVPFDRDGGNNETLCQQLADHRHTPFGTEQKFIHYYCRKARFKASFVERHRPDVRFSCQE